MNHVLFEHVVLLTESNAMVLECGLMLGLKRHEMRILTSARGLVGGDFSFRVGGEAWIRCGEHTAEGGAEQITCH